MIRPVTRLHAYWDEVASSALFAHPVNESWISACKLPAATFSTIRGAETPFAANSFSLITLGAVLTCVPDSDEQNSIISEIQRVLAPGGYVYVSDYLLQEDDRNLSRYRHFAELGFRHGVFEIDHGSAVMRHHSRDYLDELLADFDLVEEREFSLLTMKGNPATGIQLMLRKRRGGRWSPTASGQAVVEHNESHPRERGDPEGMVVKKQGVWIPVFTGMTGTFHDWSDG